MLRQILPKSEPQQLVEGRPFSPRVVPPSSVAAPPRTYERDSVASSGVASRLKSSDIALEDAGVSKGARSTGENARGKGRALQLPIDSVWVIRFPNDLFLGEYLQTTGSTLVPHKRDAKHFHCASTAERAARVLNGTIETYNPKPQQINAIENLYEEMCFLGGGEYKNFQPGNPDLGLDALVMFEDIAAPRHQRTTLAIPAKNFNADAVRCAILRKRLDYDICDYEARR